MLWIDKKSEGYVKALIETRHKANLEKGRQNNKNENSLLNENVIELCQTIFLFSFTSSSSSQEAELCQPFSSPLRRFTTVRRLNSVKQSFSSLLRHRWVRRLKCVNQSSSSPLRYLPRVRRLTCQTIFLFSFVPLCYSQEVDMWQIVLSSSSRRRPSVRRLNCVRQVDANSKEGSSEGQDSWNPLKCRKWQILKKTLYIS